MASSSKDDDRPAGKPPPIDDGCETFPATLDTATMVDDRAPVAEDVVPKRIGRYSIETTIGRGGMGVVYRAHDDQLDRPIALKLLRARGRDARRLERSRRRLLREAQALAQLSHPNVVGVHDVGEIDGQVFIAMELIKGRTLRDMIRAGDLSRHRAVALLRAAGRGLAAAHAAGMIHRDFKPSNVVVGEDGRARVLDFGLARAQASVDDESLSDGGSDAESDSHRSPPASISPHGLLAEQLTQHGVTLGTPAYMAPEQAREGRADERSDQYSFCIALFEALTGELPDPDESADQRGNRLVRAKVPRWLRVVVARGTSEHPADRYPSMDALLRALGRDERARRRTAAVAATVVALASIAVWAVVSRTTVEPGANCATGEELRGVWDAAQRTRLETAFGATGKQHAGEVFQRVASRFDDYAALWAAQRRSTCADHFERGALSDQLFDRRMACLARRRSALDATVRVLAGPIDEVVLNEAPRAAAQLPRLADCADDDTLLAAQAPPETADARKRAEVLERRLDEGEALQRAGQTTRALAIAREVAAGVEAVGYAPLTARAYSLLGNLQLEVGEYADADAALRTATLAAAEAGAHAPEARAWILRMRGLMLQGRFDDASALRDPVEIAVARAGDVEEVRAQLAYTLAWLLAMLDDPDAAHEQAEKSLALWIQAKGPRDPEVALAHVMLGNTFTLKNDLASAVHHQERAIAILSDALGPTHPDVASALHNLGIAQLGLDEAHAALESAERELAINQAAYGSDHVRTAPALRLAGRAHLALGDADRARPLVEGSIALLDAAADASPSDIAFSEQIAGDVAAAQERKPAAAKHYRRAIDLFTEAFGADATEVTETRALIEALGATF